MKISTKENKLTALGKLEATAYGRPGCFSCLLPSASAPRKRGVARTSVIISWIKEEQPNMKQ